MRDGEVSLRPRFDDPVLRIIFVTPRIPTVADDPDDHRENGPAADKDALVHVQSRRKSHDEQTHHPHHSQLHA